MGSASILTTPGGTNPMENPTAPRGRLHGVRLGSQGPLGPNRNSSIVLLSLLLCDAVAVAVALAVAVVVVVVADVAAVVVAVAAVVVVVVVVVGSGVVGYVIVGGAVFC